MNNIILIGYMGSGKSSVGKILSQHLKIPYWDTDQLIEHHMKMSIKHIFAMYGESYFRQLETECLKILLKKKERHVIAVGGGLPLKEENRRLLRELGTVVYLEAETGTIYKRIAQDRSRPLLQGENPQTKIARMLEERKPVYEEAAELSVRVDGKDFETIIMEIQEAMHENFSH